MYRTDLTGFIVGRLKVREYAGANYTGRRSRHAWLCDCECGKSKIIIGENLTNSKRPTLSCGCLNAEVIISANIKHGHGSRQENGRKRSRTWYTWRAMIDRCSYNYHKRWSSYGGRGVKVYEGWRGKNGFNTFLQDMGVKPEGATLERKDNNGNYHPSNCIWASRTENNKNRRPGNEWPSIVKRRKLKTLKFTLLLMAVTSSLNEVYT